MPKRRHEVDERPITPELVDYNDGSFIAIGRPYGASSSTPMSSDNIDMSTWLSLSTINMPGGSSVVQPPTSGYHFNMAAANPPPASFNFGQSALSPITYQATSGNSLATPSNQNSEVHHIESEQAVGMGQLAQSPQQEEGKIEAQQHGHPPEQVGAYDQQDMDHNQESDNDSSYLKNVLMAMDFRDAETDDPHYD